MEGIITSSITRPPRILVYGPPGIGKSTLGSEMPKPVFIATTDGLESIRVEMFPLAKKAEDVRIALKRLLTEDHKYKTIVLDTIGWLEWLVHEEVCSELGLKFMTAASMKSYPIAKDRMIEIMELMDRLNVEKNMFVLIVGHSTVETFEDPLVSSYSRYELALNQKVSDMIQQHVDIVGFLNVHTAVEVEEGAFGKQTTKANSNTQRMLYLDKRPQFEAKNHYNLPAQIVMKKGEQWAALYAELKKNFAPVTASNGNLSEIKKERAKKKEEKVALPVQMEELPESFNNIQGE